MRAECTCGWKLTSGGWAACPSVCGAAPSMPILVALQLVQLVPHFHERSLGVAKRPAPSLEAVTEPVDALGVASQGARATAKLNADARVDCKCRAPNNKPALRSTCRHSVQVLEHRCAAPKLGLQPFTCCGDSLCFEEAAAAPRRAHRACKQPWATAVGPLTCWRRAVRAAAALSATAPSRRAERSSQPVRGSACRANTWYCG